MLFRSTSPYETQGSSALAYGSGLNRVHSADASILTTRPFQTPLHEHDGEKQVDPHLDGLSGRTEGIDIDDDGLRAIGLYVPPLKPGPACFHNVSVPDFWHECSTLTGAHQR